MAISSGCRLRKIFVDFSCLMGEWKKSKRARPEEDIQKKEKSLAQVWVVAEWLP